jgi:hypothetical protein
MTGGMNRECIYRRLVKSLMVFMEGALPHSSTNQPIRSKERREVDGDDSSAERSCVRGEVDDGEPVRGEVGDGKSMDDSALVRRLGHNECLQVVVDDGQHLVSTADPGGDLLVAAMAQPSIVRSGVPTLLASNHRRREHEGEDESVSQ